MKKLLVVLLVLLMLFASVSCDDNQKAIDEAVAKATQALEEKAEKEKKEAVDEATKATEEKAAKEKDEAVSEAKEETKKETREAYQNFAESYSEKDKILNFIYNMVAYDYSVDSNNENGWTRTRNYTNVTEAGVINKTFGEADLSSIDVYIKKYSAEGFKELFPEFFVDGGTTSIQKITGITGNVNGNIVKEWGGVYGNYIYDYEITISDLKIEFEYKKYDADLKRVTTLSDTALNDNGVVNIAGKISQKYNEETCIATHSTESLKVQEKTYSDISAEYDWLSFKFTSAEVDGKEVDLVYVNNQLF